MRKISSSLKATGKGAVIGAATGGAGVLAGKAAAALGLSAPAASVARIAGEVAAMPAAMEVLSHINIRLPSDEKATAARKNGRGGLARRRGLMYIRPMLQYPRIAPEIVSIGPLAVRWYGAMYMLAFAAAVLLGRLRAARTGVFTRAQFDDVIIFGFLGVLLGARLGYALFYNPIYYLQHPSEILLVWKGGMSFHGGFLGVLLAQGLAARRWGLGFFTTMDFMAPLVPPGLFFVRIGNFINAELWGRVTDMPWGMAFPGAGPLPRHPSQLYEALLEGPVLFVIVWIFSSKPRPVMAVSGVFALGYGVFRCFAELFRQPDAHIGFLAFDFLTMGMLLSLPVAAAGAVLLFLAYRRK